MSKREQFRHLINDCKQGKIDIIVTKSISRFARNIVDCISTVRELLDLDPPVGVLFETERLFTPESTTEMILAMLSAVAQEESHTRSELMNISLEQRFSRGIFLQPRLLGYAIDQYGRMVIVPEEAEIIKVCFYLYASGKTNREIAELLNAYKKETIRGCLNWYHGDISYILHNEKYCGDLLSRKTYTPNYLDHKSRKNKQKRNQYFQYDHHEPIIPRELYTTVKLMNAYNKHHSQSHRGLPSITVIKSGVLRGFIPINASILFSYEEYLEASLTAGKMNLKELTEADIAKEMELDFFDGYQVVREEFFRDDTKLWINIHSDSFTFTKSCVEKFKRCPMVELLYNPQTEELAVIPCEAEKMNSITWWYERNGCFESAHNNNSDFGSFIMDRMHWNSSYAYIVHGQYVKYKKSGAIIFRLKDGMRSEEISLKPNRSYRLPDSWMGNFGMEYREYATLQSRYKEFGRNTAPVLVKSDKIIKPKEMAKLKEECDRIIEGWKQAMNE